MLLVLFCFFKQKTEYHVSIRNWDSDVCSSDLSAFDPLLTPGTRNYWKSHDFTELSDGAIDTIVEAVGRLPGPECEIFIAQVGGAMSHVAPEATAYPQDRQSTRLNSSH